jgi:hypothetical protein
MKGDIYMRIFDIYDNELFDPDLTLGYLQEDKIFVKHHPATDEVEEKWHYEIIAEYANGGKDIKKIIDVPGVPGQEAWDEYESIYRYILSNDETIPSGPSELELLREKVA